MSAEGKNVIGVAELSACASVASCIAARMYNTIRAVGHGELTADNALHRFIEDVHDARRLMIELNSLCAKARAAAKAEGVNK